jgi:hypothetical protein
MKDPSMNGILNQAESKKTYCCTGKCPERTPRVGGDASPYEKAEEKGICTKA